jgi:general secretion pathway protein D
MTRTRFWHGLAGRAVALWLAALPALAAGEGADEVSLDFVNADIDVVVRAVSKIAKRNLVVDPRVKGTLNVVTNRPVTPVLAYQILLSALRLQGYAVVENDGVVLVLPEADAKLHAVPVSTGRSAARGDRLITQLFTPRHESAAQLLPVIRPLVSPNNTVAAYPNNNTLVVTDYAENVDRIGRIIDAIDIAHGEVVAIPLKHASALDVAPTISRLLGEGNTEASQRVTIVADSRINALLVRSDSPPRLAAVRGLAASLDQESIAGNIHIIYLKNAEAAKVAQILRGLLAGDAGTPTAAANGQGTAGGAPGSTGAVASATGSAAGGGMIQADPASNALIITAPEAIYNNLRHVVDGLDRRRAQVHVEALIAEISADRAAEFGIQWQSANTPTGAGGSTVFGGTNFSSGGSNILAAAASPSAISTGLNLAIASGTITLPGSSTPILNLTMLARALESHAGTNILSTPNIVTLDNEEAKIVVGQNVPFVTGQYTNTGTSTSTVSPFQTISRQDVGLTLRIKPRISEGGTVRMQIFQESSSVVASTISNTSGPTTSKRSIETAALVDDGAIIALGGLVEDNYVASTEKVPLLGDLPLVGNAFRYDSRRRTKTNLVVFLRPRILRDAQSYHSLTADRYEQVLGQQRQRDSGDRRLRNEPSAPELPPWVPVPAASLER